MEFMLWLENIINTALKPQRPPQISVHSVFLTFFILVCYTVFVISFHKFGAITIWQNSEFANWKSPRIFNKYSLYEREHDTSTNMLKWGPWVLTNRSAYMRLKNPQHFISKQIIWIIYINNLIIIIIYNL